MPLKFHCVCGQALIVSRKRVGEAVRCPQCDVKVKVPAPRGTTAVHSGRPAATSVAPPPGPSAVAAPPLVSPDAVAEELSDVVAGANSVRGCEPYPRHAAAAQWLAIGLVFVALFGAAPAAWEIARTLATGGSAVVDVWAYLALWVALVEISFAIYLVQLPDWSSVWVATLVTLTIAASYAMLLGLTYLSRPDGWLVTSLDLSAYVAGGRAAGWSFIMVCLTSLISYLGGRLSLRWYEATA